MGIRVRLWVSPGQPVDQVVVTATVNDGGDIHGGLLAAEMSGEAPDSLLAGNMQGIYPHKKHTAFGGHHLLHQRRGTQAALVGILPHKAVPQGRLHILVIDHGRQLFRPDGLQPPAHRLGDDAAEGQALDAACQQMFQRRQVCLRITGGGEFQQGLHAVLLGIGDAAVDALHDLFLEIRFTERYQHADLVLFPGEVEGPA